MITIAAFSDSHGTLPPIEKHVDVVCIAGDISPLRLQTYNESMKNWFCTEFLEWCDKVPTDLILLVPGNHDFFFEYVIDNSIKSFIESVGLSNKVKILIDESCVYKDKIFYGCPWCQSPRGWAFISTKYYKDIPKCDVLICHQPPAIEKVGWSYPDSPWERNFSSEELAERILEINPRIVFCGHIHTGQAYAKDNDTEIYNVSLLDEEYVKFKDVTWTSLE